MRHGITGIDHPVIGVRDMDQACRVYERLGYTVPPRGSHIEWELCHRNGATGIVALSGIVKDLDGAVTAQQKLFGPRSVSRRGDHIQISVGRGAAIVLSTAEAFCARYPAGRSLTGPDPPLLAAVTLAVEDLDATAACLSSRDVRWSGEASKAIHVAADEACGVLMEFVARGRSGHGILPGQ